MWQDKKYQFITLYIYLYEDHLTWDEVGFAGRQFTLFYTDIISVSGGNAGKHLGGTSRFEINTAGQTYKYSSTLGAFVGLEECMRIINERIQFYRNKGAGSANSAGFANNININPENVEPTITRIDIFLEDGEWGKVTAYANAALDYFPTDYRLYKYLLLVDMRCKSIGNLKNCSSSFASNGNYKKLDRYADESLKKELKDILEYIEKEPIYKQAKSTSDNKKALELFNRIREYKDSKDCISTLQTKIKEDEKHKREKEEEDKESKYQVAIQLQNQAKTIEDYEKALEEFEKLKTIAYDNNLDRYYDIVKRHKEVQEKYDELKIEKEYADAIEDLASGEVTRVKAAKKIFDKHKEYKESREKSDEAQAIIDNSNKEKRKKIIIASCIAAVVLAVVVIISVNQQSKRNAETYKAAIELYDAGSYDQALEAFNSLGSYEDAQSYAEKCSQSLEKQSEMQALYDEALEDFKYGRFEDAKKKLNEIEDFADSKDKIQEITGCEEKIEKANSLIKEGNLCEALVPISELPESIDSSVTEKLRDLISTFGNYAGYFEHRPTKLTGGNAITRGGKDINEIHVKVLGINPDLENYQQSPVLLIEYDGGSIELKEHEIEKSNLLRYSNYEDDYYVRDCVLDDYYKGEYHTGEAFEIEDGFGWDRHTTIYYRKDEPNNVYRY